MEFNKILISCLLVIIMSVVAEGIYRYEVFKDRTENITIDDGDRAIISFSAAPLHPERSYVVLNKKIHDSHEVCKINGFITRDRSTVPVFCNVNATSGVLDLYIFSCSSDSEGEYIYEIRQDDGTIDPISQVIVICQESHRDKKNEKASESRGRDDNLMAIVKSILVIVIIILVLKLMELVAQCWSATKTARKKLHSTKAKKSAAETQTPVAECGLLPYWSPSEEFISDPVMNHQDQLGSLKFNFRPIYPTDSPFYRPIIRLNRPIYTAHNRSGAMEGHMAKQQEEFSDTDDSSDRSERLF